jgi:hypothetical protein
MPLSSLEGSLKSLRRVLWLGCEAGYFLLKRGWGDKNDAALFKGGIVLER